MNKIKCSNCGIRSLPKYYNQKNYCNICFDLAKMTQELDKKVTSLLREVKEALYRAKLLQERRK